MIFFAMLMACTEGTGLVDVSVWGEDEPVEGLELDDGWTVELDHWVLGIGDLRLSDLDTEEVVVQAPGPWAVDLTEAPEPVLLTGLAGPAARVHFGFAFLPPAGASVVGTVDGAVVTEMADAGFTHHVAGTATDGTETITFSWGFSNEADYTACENGADGSSGIAISEGEFADATIYVHTDHAFWDRLGSEEAQLRFGPIADADADGDGDVTVEELQAVSTVDIGYETAGLDLDDLYAFLSFSITQSGHLNGDGLCTVRAR